MIEYSAGIVTAYGSAVRAGYTGTYEDFCRQQAQYAENAQAVEQAKQDAQTARNQAQTAKDDAVTAKNTAVSAKDDAVSAKNTAVSAKDDAVLAKNTATTKAQEAGQSATSAGLSATSASQSAQNAEQSAQGVSGSLAQIQTNKEDIDTLKADLANNVNNLKSAINLLNSASLITVADESFSQSVETRSDYKISIPVELIEGKEYYIKVEINDIAGGSWVSTSYPVALCVYLSRGNVGPNSQYIKRKLISQSALNTTTYIFNFVATSTDAEANYLCVYVQLNPSGNFAGKIVVNSAYNIPDKMAEIEPLLYVNTSNSHGEWTQGTINSSDGAINTRSDRIADATYYDSDEIDNVYVNSNYDLLYGLYTSNDINGFVSTSSWVKSVNAFSQKYVRFAVRKSAGGNILPSENTGFTIVYKKKTVQSAIEDFDGFTVPYAIGSTNQVARLGWKVYANDTPPEQSIASYVLAYKNHARIMLCDVRVTADGEYICWHDSDLGAELGTNTVRHADGTALTTEEKEQLVSSLTLEQLNAYDYGMYKGAEYAGTKMLTLFDFVKWCALANCIPMLEIKVQLTSSQVSEIATMIKAVGLSDRVIIDDYQSHFANNLSDWLSELPNSTICVIAGAGGYNSAITMCRTAIESGNKALITLSATSQLAQIQDQSGNLDISKVALATDYGIGLSYTELANDSALLEFYNGGYMDVFSYIACRTRLDNWIASKIGI